MSTVKRTRALPPYTDKGRTTFPVRNVPGVYLIYKAGTLRYVGYGSADVYKALYRHFQTWNDPRKERVTYVQLHDVRVRVIYCKSGRKAAELERALIVKYRPQDNPDKLRQHSLDRALSALAKEAEEAGLTYNEEAPF